MQRLPDERQILVDRCRLRLPVGGTKLPIAIAAENDR